MKKKQQLEQELKDKLPDLITKLKNGDSSVKEEFAILLLPYVTLLCKKFAKFIEDEAMSLAGIVITRLINKIEKVDLSKSVLGFIARSTINYCIDRNRYKNFKCRKKDNLGEDALRKIGVGSGAYFSNYDNESIETYLEDSFNELDSQIISLYFIDSRSPQEISAITGQPEKEIMETVSILQQAK